MGIVYLAEQHEPMRRLVALKLVKAPKADAKLLSRFEAERRALARLNHPNVAHVYDSGTADDGSPYIVMEHVPGETITQFCEDRKATIGERIEVFIDVCRGVQHVHQKGLVHRDLKPPNILVTDLDGTWIPKIIDFGIAKGMGKPLLDDTLTNGQLIGTPMYVAPEALKGEHWDTRVDVYALGLVLYRLLIGVKPVPPELSANMLVLIQNLAKGEAVPTLTQRFKQLSGEQRQRLSRDRRVQPRAMEVAFSRDLDWILMRAIHFDPEERYPTPMALADDLQRYLDGVPVTARPPSIAYVGAKALRRHRLPVVGLTLLLLSMGAGIVSTAYQARQAELHAAEADERRKEAEEVSRVMAEMFTSANPFQRSAGEPTVRDLLDRAATSLEGRDLPPAVRGRLLGQVRNAYMSLGAYGEAAELSAKAVETLDRDGSNPLHLVAALATHTKLLSIERREEEAMVSANRAMELYNSVKPGGPTLIGLHLTISRIHRLRGELDEACDAALIALRAAETSTPVVAMHIAASAQELAAAQMLREDLDEAEATLKRALDYVRDDENDLVAANLKVTLAELKSNRGDSAGAIEQFEQALPVLEARMGKDHPLTQSIPLRIAIERTELGLLDLAEPVLRAHAYGSDEHPRTHAVAGMSLAILESKRGNAEASLRLFRLVAADDSGHLDSAALARARSEVERLEAAGIEDPAE